MSLFHWLFQRPYLLLVLTTFFWGCNAIAGKMAVGHVSPYLLTTARWFVAMAIVYPFAIRHLRRDWQVIRPRLPFLIMLGIVGFTIFNNLMYSALVHTSAVNVALIQASMPLMVFALNFTLFKLRTTPMQLTGFGLTLCGVLAVVVRGDFETLITLAFNLGDVLMLMAIMAYGIYSVLLKNKPQIHWLSFIAILGTSAFFSSLLFTGWEIANNYAVWPDKTGLMIILFVAVFPSITSQVLWMRGLELIGSNRGGVFINLVPIYGSALAILLLGERFQPYHGLALVLVLGGVWLSQRPARQSRNPEPPVNPG